MKYPDTNDLTLFRLNNGNTLIGILVDYDEEYSEVGNPALIVESVDAVNTTNVDIVPAIQKYYVEEGASLDGMSWLLDKKVVVVVSNNSLKLSSKILTAYNNIFNPVEANADSNTRI
jgi:hypothetical protein